MKTGLKCYISATYSPNIGRLQHLLSDLDVNTHDLHDFAIGTSFADLMKRKIKESDFVLALIEDNNSNVMFELGIAEALNKPIFVIVEKGAKLPFFLESSMHFDLDWSKNIQLLELSLKNYIIDISKTNKKYLKRKIDTESTNLSINDTNEKLIELRNLRNRSFREDQLIQIILDVFKKINVQAVSELNFGDRSRVDIAITNDQLSTYFGNPVLFEVKTGHINKNVIERTQNQLQNYLSKTEAQIGILLYFDKDNKRFTTDYQIAPNILAIDIEDFILGISSEGLEKFLIKFRNQYVHGINKLS